ncbi:hypothetical protein F5Y14DRAFT_412704 [Nemania sp. NC0429]|nr:hypothetical protein F5Y14DRAFT_412704 [Nemania sp. NC0429]
MSTEVTAKNDEIIKVLEGLAIDPDTFKSQKPLAALYSKCLLSFQKFLTRSDPYYGSDYSSGLERCYEEYSRFKLWGDEKGATLELSVPGSLEATLRGHPEVQNILSEIYEQIENNLNMLNGSPLGPLAESFALLTDDSSDDDNNPDDQPTTPSDSTTKERFAISRTIASVFQSIEELYRCSSLIRQPRFIAGSLQRARSNLDAFHLQEYQYVRHKLLLWQKKLQSVDSQKRGIELMPENKSQAEENPATPQLIADRQSAEKMRDSPESILSLRLAIANSKRRAQFKYWDVYYRRIGSDTHESTIIPPISENAETGSTTLTSAILTSTWSSVPRSTTVPEATQTIYTPASASNYRELKVPDLPHSDNPETAMGCPYCHTTLGAEELSLRSKWERHVFRDLRPYVCTFTDCLDPDRLFTTRYDWIYHEMQLHRRQWNCQSCVCTYLCKSEMVEHLQNAHGLSLRERDIATLIEMSERPIDEDHVDKCPFCYATMSIKELLDHMADHMEKLALFSLPQNHDETGEIADVGLKIESISQSGSVLSNETANSDTLSQCSKEQADDERGTKHNKSSDSMGKSSDSMGKSSDAMEKTIKSTGKSALKKKRLTYIIGYYCCGCGHGPWFLNTTANCQHCGRQLCSECPTEEIKIDKKVV